MSWTYSGDPKASDIDRCRFIIGDTVEVNPIMQDEEIQYLVDTYKTEATLYYQLFSKAATIFARDIKRSLGPQSEDPTERLKFYKEQMEYYKTVSNSSNISLPLYAAPKAFRVNMQTNPPNRKVGGRYV